MLLFFFKFRLNLKKGHNTSLSKKKIKLVKSTRHVHLVSKGVYERCAFTYVI